MFAGPDLLDDGFLGVGCSASIHDQTVTIRQPDWYYAPEVCVESLFQTLSSTPYRLRTFGVAVPAKLLEISAFG
jgi:hypothetical protein